MTLKNPVESIKSNKKDKSIILNNIILSRILISAIIIIIALISILWIQIKIKSVLVMRLSLVL